MDKTGCISFHGGKYEVGLQYIGRKVEVFYDPSWEEEIEVHYKDCEPFKVKTLQIGPNCGVRRELPNHLLPVEVDSSRLLDGLNKANITNRTKREVAVVFRKSREVEGDV